MPKGRKASAFGSFGWAGGAVGGIEEMIKVSGMNLIQPGIGVRYMPDTNETNACFDFGKNFAKSIKGGN
jgi:flavorubredoxin